MASSLESYIKELRQPVPEVLCEPDLDDIDEKVDNLLREQMDLSAGVIRKGIIEKGEGSSSPAEGDLVYFHLSLKKENGDIVETTRPDEQGSGVPKAYILGKGHRMPRGWELALEEMLKGERAVFRIDPEYSYAQKGCHLKPPDGVAPDASLLLDIQLVNWYKRKGIRALESGVIKRTVKDSESWEHPHPPFEVEVSLKARVPSSSGRQGEGPPYFATTSPLRWELGSGRVSELLEEGICSMAKSEHAFICCHELPSASSNEGLLPPPPHGVERVEYEVELLAMLQVRDLTGTGEVTKRRIKEGIGEFPIDCPLEDNAVRIHYKASLAFTGQAVYNSRGADGSGPPLEFDTGVDAVPAAVDMCVRLMTPQEVAVVRSAAKFAYDSRSDRPPDCPVGADIDFEIELVGFQKTPSWHSMTAANKIARAEQLRQQGNATFKAGQLQYARQKYLKALKLLDNAYDAETEEEMLAASNAKASCLANLALVCQKEENFTECFSWCEKALREQPDHPKALFRRGTTHALLGNFEQAVEDLLLAKAADSSAAADIDREISRMKQRKKASDSKERREFKSFFDRY